MNLGITRNAPPLTTDQQNGPEEVRPSFEIPTPGIFDDHRLAARGFQLLRPQGVVEPQRLNMALCKGKITFERFMNSIRRKEFAIVRRTGKKLIDRRWSLIEHEKMIEEWRNIRMME